MADQKISQMPAASTLTGAELVPLVQNGLNVRSTLGNVKAFNNAYIAVSSDQDQTGNVSIGTVMTFSTVDIQDSITLVNGSRITVPNTGIYNLQFSAQIVNTDNEQHNVKIWFRVNDSDVTNSATDITIPSRKTSNIYGYGVAAWNIFLSLTAGQYVQLVWLPSSALVTLEHIPLSASPAVPAIPSIIATMNQVA
jgi:hypothetical protein